MTTQPITLKVNLMVFQTKEKKNDKSPDYEVKAKIHDEFHTIGYGWKKVSKVGTTFLSLSVVNHHLKELIGESETTSNGTPVPDFDKKLNDF